MKDDFVYVDLHGRECDDRTPRGMALGIFDAAFISGHQALLRELKRIWSKEGASCHCIHFLGSLKGCDIRRARSFTILN